MSVDLYVGGAEHAVLHLLYSRFWHKVLYDLDLVHTPEPFQKLLNPGMILGYSYRYYDDNLANAPDFRVRAVAASQVKLDGETATDAKTGAELKARWVNAEDVRWSDDGTPRHPEIEGLELEVVTEKMSKSRGNVVSPDDVIEQFGADALRLYEMFMGPLEKGAPWSAEGIPGMHRFLQRAHRLVAENEESVTITDGAGTKEQAQLTARTIQEVTDDVENLRLNTAISKLMVFVRDIVSENSLPREAAEAFVLLLNPFAPHLAEELWRSLDHQESPGLSAWPEPRSEFLETDRITLAVQVNGKRRDEVEVAADASEDEIRAMALASERVQSHLEGRDPRKVILVPGRLINIVA